MFSLRSCALWALLSSSLVYGGLVQKPNLVLPPGSSDQRDAVVAMFNRSWASYTDNAWGSDDLLPLSNSSSNGRNGWGASIADAMSTMYIMGLQDDFAKAVAFMSQVDFSKSNTTDTVSVFETTIRYLAGILSAYELSNQQYPALLAKAGQLADKLSYAWVGENDIPFGYVDFSSNTPTEATSNIAEAGTLTMEWATLSKYTQNDKYRQLAERSALHIASLPAPLPGLPAQGINPSTGTSVGGYVTWGGGSDSYFEYLIKYARLNNDASSTYADTWRLAVDSSVNTLLKTSTVGEHVYLADYDDSSNKILHVGSHLACFYGGNWLLGGQLLDNQTIVDIGLQLTDACWNTYASTATGIGPETFAFASADGNYTGGANATQAQQEFYDEHGFYITGADYILRPEVLESNFYAWRVSGDTKYVDRAASAVQSFNRYLSVNGAYSGIWDVNNANIQNSDRIDDMESFWFAEVLKYLYLTFDDPTHISLDEYVFNTEAHPFKLDSPNAQYGTGATPTSSEQSFKVTQGETPEVSAIPGIPSLTAIIQGILDDAEHLFIN